VVAVLDPPFEPLLPDDADCCRCRAELDVLRVRDAAVRELPLRELDERDRLPDERDDPLDDDFRWVLGAVLLGDERVLA
jgi:hypothetical protein